MSNRRMFSFRIINTAKFLTMPNEAQNLYFHLGLRADDDGVVEAYPVLKILGTTSDNLKLLVAKNYIEILNDEFVVFIVDWLEHNSIRADRKVDSIYQELLKDKKTIQAKPRSDVKDNSKRTGGLSTDGIGKDRIGKVKIINIPFSTFWNLYDYKKSKPIAEKKWNSLTDEEREKVIEALPDYIASTNKNGKYPPRKYPTTYLNQEGWEDEIIKGRGIIDYDAMGLT